MILKHEFVKYMPGEIQNGHIYISIEFCVAVHLCPCGCGNKIVTPLSPTGWILTFDGLSISLTPSIGSWNLECKSHYWIIKNKIEWSRKWSDKEIKVVRAKDKKAKEDYYKNKNSKQKKEKKSFWSKVKIF